MLVKLKTGIDQVRFGMTMDEVRELWGHPDSIEYFIPIEKQPEQRSVEWNYANGITLSFDSEDEFLLTCISATSKSVLINGKTIVGNSIPEISESFPTIELEEDFEELGQNFEIPDLNISIWVVGEVADTVNIFPEYDESGNNIIWPHASS